MTKRYRTPVNILSPKEMEPLWPLVKKGDKKAKEKIFASCFPYLIKLAHRHNKGRDRGPAKLDDLIQVGSIGLWHAIDKYEPERGVKILSYATYWMQSCMQRGAAAMGFVVQVGTTNDQRVAMRAYYRGETSEGMSSASGLSEESCERLYGFLSRPITSLDNPSLNGFSLGETIAADGLGPEEETEERERRAKAKQMVAQAMSHLTFKEQSIIHARILSEFPKTLDEVGREYKVTRERIRQIEKRALAKIKKSILRQEEFR